MLYQLIGYLTKQDDAINCQVSVPVHGEVVCPIVLAVAACITLYSKLCMGVEGE